MIKLRKLIEKDQIRHLLSLVPTVVLFLVQLILVIMYIVSRDSPFLIVHLVPRLMMMYTIDIEAVHDYHLMKTDLFSDSCLLFHCID